MCLQCKPAAPAGGYYFFSDRIYTGVWLIMVYTVKDIQKILDISKTAAYALVDGSHFPVKRIGRSIRISKEAFHKWLNDYENTEVV